MRGPDDPCEAVYLRCALPGWTVIYDDNGNRLSRPGWLGAKHQSGLAVLWVRAAWREYLRIDAPNWAFLAYPELMAVRQVHLLDRRAVQPYGPTAPR